MYPNYTPKDVARFWKKVSKATHPKGCWLWIAGKLNGYGRVGWNKRTELSHRVSYLLANGEFPDNLDVLHSCENKNCVNPKHLYLSLDSDETRFWSHVDKSPHPRGCWLWTACCSKAGYGKASWSRIVELAHRISFFLAYGEYSEELEVLHKCDNPPCVNPEHLFLGTQGDNMDDKVEKGRQARGERHGGHKLNGLQVSEIRRLYAKGGILQRELGDQFGISKGQIGRIFRSKNWTDTDSPQLPPS